MKKGVKRALILALSAVLTLMTFITSLTGVNATMQPIEEKQAYLIMKDKTDEQLKAVPITEVLDNLTYENGNRVDDIPDDAKIVWTYYKDNEGKVIRDEYHEINREETVDLTYFDGQLDYTLELIVGSGKQLDTDSVRYIVKVIIDKNYVDNITLSLYDAQTGEEINPKTKDVADVSADCEPNWQTEGCSYDASGNVIPILGFVFSLNEEDGEKLHNDGILLRMNSSINERIDVDVQVYYLSDPQLTTPITDQILGDSAPGIVAKDSGDEQAYGLIVVYYIDGVQKDLKIVLPDISTTSILSIEGQLMNAASEQVYSSVNLDADINTLNHTLDFTLIRGKKADESYKLLLTMTDGGEESNNKIRKAVIGRYETMEEAADAEDIQSQLFETGYESAQWGEGVEFTVFYVDGYTDGFVVGSSEVQIKEIIEPYYLSVKATETPEMPEFDDAPVVGAQDPWFRVTGLMLDGRVLPTYVIENGKAINMDTYYGYGYQTIMVDAELTEDDKKRLVPIFEVADPDRLRVLVVRNGDQTELISGETKVDFSLDEIESEDGKIVNDKGLAHIIVDFDDGEHLKNYQLRVISRESGPKLYVYDDHKELIDGEVIRSREVLLTDYFENKHDILIANIGDQPLTGLSVTLEPVAEGVPKNVKLDDYWAIGGENNNVLPEFGDPEKPESITDKSAYGMIQNVAKVRLLPDGDGEGGVNAKLVITADGQEPVVVYLSDEPRQPQIVYDELPDGVKYVPYSAYVITDNMYDWNPQSFAITSGTLPPGLNLLPTGEIYGVPTEANSYTFTVTASFGSEYFEDASQEMTLVIKDNTDDNVFEASDGTDETNVNYEIQQVIGTEESQYHYVVDEAEAYEDQVFVSNGVLDDFVALWLNGKKLYPGTDYTFDSGSTIITIKGQTFGEKCNRGEGENGRNTIAMEFRNDNGGNKTHSNPDTGDHSKDLRRTSQNYYIYTNTTPVDPTPVLPQNVTLRARVIDENDQPLANANLELHSTVRYGTTNADGIAVFSAVEFGDHTVYVKDSSNNALGSQAFKLVEGQSSSVNGNVITAPRGSDVALTIKVNTKSKEAAIEDVEVTPNTADHNQNALWISLLGISVLIGAAVYAMRKRITA